MRMKVFLAIAAATLWAVNSTSAYAGVAVTLLSNQNTGYGDRPTDQFSLGFQFVAKADMLVTSLGYWGGDETPTVDLDYSHDVGIYDASSQTLLASTTVAAGTPLDSNGFAYSAITPYLLTAGQTYVISATSVGPADRYVWQAVPTPIYDPAIEYQGGKWDYASTLIFPTRPATYDNAYFGPNFQFAAVPEPASLAVWSLLGLTLGVGAYSRRRLAG